MTINSATSLPTTQSPIDPAQLKRSGAAKDFESLLIAQMLRSVRESGSGWLGAGEDQSSDAAFGLGEEQLAKALSGSGGIGLSKIIDAGLKAHASSTEAKPQTPSAETQRLQSSTPEESRLAEARARPSMLRPT